MPPSRSLLSITGALDIRALGDLLARPPLDAPHESRFWNDPYISRQMLHYHLDPNTDAASRKPDTIDRTVAWLVEYLALRPGQRVIDLGCGPGLYCTRLAQRGLAVTGLDFSANSIEYAREQAAASGQPIDYVCSDYLCLDFHEEFDAALLIYLDYGVLPPSDRGKVLDGVRQALRPGGAFAFDVVTPAHPFPPDGHTSWAVGGQTAWQSASRFWRPSPYLELTRHFAYEEAGAHLEQTAVVEESGAVSLYRIWQHTFTPESIAAELSSHGFAVEGVFADLTGTAYAAESTTMAVVARKPR